MSEYTDDLIKQGMAGSMAFGIVFDPPWGPEHRCPGCQPRPLDASEAWGWDTWHAVEKKMAARGERSACPILRGETLPACIPHERPTLPDPRVKAAPVVAPVEPVAVEQEGPKVEPAPLIPAVAAPVEPRPVKRQTRKAKTPAPAPTGQTNLF
jgi:hypothetical protein